MEKKHSNNHSEDHPQSNVFNFLRFGESYTSLILGIVVVIIATVLFLGVVRAKNIKDTPQITDKSITTQTNPGFQNTLKVNPNNKNISTNKDTEQAKDVSPTAALPSPTVVKKQNTSQLTTRSKYYVVSEGDSLWNIASKKYNNGYNWVQIARSNNLSNPDNLYTGQKLSLPEIDQKNNTINYEKVQNENSTKDIKITSDKYVVNDGDNLWDIAVRAYGDGYKWTSIAQSNKLSNPDLIYVKQSLILPRK